MVRKIILLILAVMFYFSGTVNSFAEVKIKFIVMNPSVTERREVPFSFNLPPEVKPENVLDTAGLDLTYDVDNSSYAIKGTTTLDPKETKVFQVIVEDIWQIPDQTIDFLRQHSQEKLQSLEGTNSEQIASSLVGTINQRINEVEATQREDLPIQERVEAYRVNKKKVKSIENDIFVLEQLAADVERSQNLDTVTISVEVKNPSPSKKAELPVEYYLPPEIRYEDVVDSAGFDVQYDLDKGQIFVKKTIEFEPGEIKKYQFKIRDVFGVSEAEINSLESETDKILQQVSGSSVEELGQFLGNKINDLLGEVKEIESKGDIKTRIAGFRDNKEKITEANDYLERLKTLLLQLELTKASEAGETQSEAKKQDITFGGGKAEGKGGGFGQGLGSALGKARGQSKAQRGGGIKAIRGLKGLILISKSIFKGWKPNIATTWKIILAIIGFLGLFALLFYFLWWGGSKKQMGQNYEKLDTK